MGVAVFDVAYPSVLELGTTSIPLMDRASKQLPAIMTMTVPQTHAPSSYHLMHSCSSVAGIDVLRCDHQVMRFWTTRILSKAYDNQDMGSLSPEQKAVYHDSLLFENLSSESTLCNFFRFGFYEAMEGKPR